MMESDVSHDHIVEYNIAKALGLPPERNIELLDWVISTDGYAQAKPIAGAIEGLRILAVRHEIHFLSSRPTTLEAVTRDWLQRYGVMHKALTLGLNCPKVRNQMDLFVDDDPTDLHLALDLCDRVLLFDQPWNRTTTQSSSVERVLGWQHLMNTIEPAGISE